MAATIDLLDPSAPKRVAMLASNPSTSPVTGWPVGFWWAELVHPYWEFAERGYEVDVYSPDGGALAADSWSDPRDESGYSAHDILSLGFISSPRHAALVERSRPLAELDVTAYDAIFLVGGQAPMVTFVDDERVHGIVRAFHEAGKVAAVVCHATAALLRTTLSDGTLLVAGKTWTGFANSEEDFADAFVGQRIQPFRIEDEARAIEGTNFVVNGRFKPFAVRDGILVTGQQQYSGAAAARLVIEALGV
ncbi:MAG: type 1 glutamine amidotransferase domain-containing protein [Thermoleophilia bacterium]